MYFHCTRNPKDLKLALSAYEKTDPSSMNPDLYHSRAIIHQYFENYEKAIADLKQANSLDRSLECDEIINSIEKFTDTLYGELRKSVIFPISD